MKILQILPLLAIVVLSVTSCEKDPVEPTISLEDFTVTVDENIAEGTSLGTISGSTNTGTLRYSLTTQTPAMALSINPSSGELTVQSEAAFNFEENNVILATVVAENQVVSKTATITVTLNDLEEPTITIWSGPQITFTKEADVDISLESNQDRLNDEVWITRFNDGGQIVNIKVETASVKEESPVGTLWAVGTTAEIESLEFEKFRDVLGQPKDRVGEDLVMYLIDEDAYLDIRFTSWSAGSTSGGAVSYIRSTRN